MDKQQLREQLYRVIFGTDTKAGQRFDIFLIYAILISVLAVILTTVESLSSRYALLFFSVEWFFTALFTVEYGLRIFCSPNRRKYLFSFDYPLLPGLVFYRCPLFAHYSSVAGIARFSGVEAGSLPI